MGVDDQAARPVELADGGGELSRLACVVGEVLADDDPLRRPGILRAQHEDGNLGVVHDLLGLAAHHKPHHIQDEKKKKIDLRRHKS